MAQFSNKTKAPVLVILTVFLLTGLSLTWGNAPWWESFGDARLNRLMADTWKNNGDIAALQERIHQADAQLLRARSQLYPSLNVTSQNNLLPYEASAMGMGAPPLPNPPETMVAGGVYLNARYPLHAWGREWQTSQAAKYQTKAVRQDKESLKLTLGGRVASAYFGAIYAQSLLRIQQDQIKASQDVLELARTRFRSGEYTLLPVLQQEQALAAVETMTPAIKTQLRKQLEQLSALTGSQIDQQFLPEKMPLLKEGPVLSDDTQVTKRPDLIARKLRLRSSEYSENASWWAHFPTAELTGRTGWDYLNIHSTDWESAWSLGINLTLPLFNGFGARAGVKDAGAMRRSAEHSLSQAERAALADLRAYTQQEQDQFEALAAHQKHEQSARKAYTEAKEYFRNGLAGYLEVLNSQNALFQSQKNVLNAQLSLLNTRMLTIQSRGGNL